MWNSKTLGSVRELIEYLNNNSIPQADLLIVIAETGGQWTAIYWTP